MTAIDYAWSHPSVDALKAAGATGVLRYLAPLPNGKVIGAAEYQALRGAGVDVALNWEFDAQDWLGGAGRGEAHAAEAVRQAKALGYPAGSGIYGSCDMDMTRAQWLAGGRAYGTAFRDGVRSGGYRVGVYGPWDVLQWCHDELGLDLYWQCMSTGYSGGRNRTRWPGAHLRQRRSTTIGGADCDVNDIIQADWGQQTGGLHMDADVQQALDEILYATQEARRWAANSSEAFYGAGDGTPGFRYRWQEGNFDSEDVRPNPLVMLSAKLDALAAQPAPVQLTDADRAAIGQQLAGLVSAAIEPLKAELDQLKAALGAAGAQQAELLAPAS